MRRFRLLFTPLLLLAAVVLPVRPGAGQERLNVLFIVSDDLGTRLGCYGDRMVKSPAIDALAERGVRFERAYCQFPLCNPSRASFLTGLRPQNTGVVENRTHFREKRPDHVTLPQAFRRAGYRVARVGKLYHYGVPGQIGTDGLDDPPSWDQVVNPRGRDKDREETIFSLVPGQFGGTLSWRSDDGTDEEQTDGLGATAAIRLLDENRDRPFFLAVGFYRPHTPYVAPRRYFDMYPTASIRLSEVSPDERTVHPAPAFGSAKREQDRMTDDQRREAIRAYSAATTLMDAQVGRVLAELRRLDLERRTIVVFLSDHGYHLGEHGLWQKMSLFENSARVPLILAGPGISIGRTCRRQVELVDLYPTLAEICGLETPSALDGVSLRPWLRDPGARRDRPAFTQVTRAAPTRFGWSVRSGRWRYTEWGDAGSHGKQLVDLQADPGEQRNLATDPAQAERIRQFAAQIASLRGAGAGG